MPLHIRRVKMDDHPNRGDVKWVLFEEGNIAKPLLLLSDNELDSLLDSIYDQRSNHKEA